MFQALKTALECLKATSIALVFVQDYIYDVHQFWQTNVMF